MAIILSIHCAQDLLYQIRKYYFEEITKCEMCGDPTDKHQVLGQRFSQSQELSPKKITGISVSIKKCTKCELIYPLPLPIPFDLT